MSFAEPVALGNMRWWTSLAGILNFGTPGSISSVAGRVYLTALWVPRHFTISRITVNVNSSAASGNSLRLGLYEDNGGTPAGARLLEDSGNIAADTTGVKVFILPSPRALRAGIYWIALETEAAVTAHISRNGTLPVLSEVGSERMGGGFFDRAGGYGPFPSPCPTVESSSTLNFTTRVRVDRVAG
mgnify:CR=1 FL=1